MGFNNKIIVIIDVGTDDDTRGGHVVFIFSPGAQTCCVHTSAFVVFHYLVDSVTLGQDMLLFCAQIYTLNHQQYNH